MKIKELIIILILIGFFAYFPSFFGNFIWDDEDFVYANTYVKNFQINKFWTENAIAGRGKLSNYYRPIQFSMYALIYKIAGPNPAAFHAVGIALHIITAIIVITVITVITGSASIGFLTALFFLIHPGQTESISYISGHSDPLYTIFFLLSILFFLKRNERTIYRVLSVIFFIISLLSKELALVLPGIILLISLRANHHIVNDGQSNPDNRFPTLWGLFRRFAPRNDIVLIAVFFFIALLYLVSRFTFLKFSDIALYWAGNPYGEYFTIRLATFFRLFFSFLKLILFPQHLFMERDFTIPIQYSLINVWTVLSFLIHFIIVITLYLKAKFQTKYSSNQLPITNHQFPNLNNQYLITNNLYSFSLLFYLCFLVALIPYTGIFLLNGIFYEHYAYLPQVFFWAGAFSLLHQKLKINIIKIMIIITLCLFFVRSYVRQYEWIDNERFYRQTLSFAPKSIRMLNGLGMTLAEKGECEKAIAVYKNAIQLNKTIPNIYHNIANCYVVLKRIDLAEQYYLHALGANPKFVFSYNSLLNLYKQTGQQEKMQRLIDQSPLHSR